MLTIFLFCKNINSYQKEHYLLNLKKIARVSISTKKLRKKEKRSVE